MYRYLGKRLLDVIAGSTALLVLSPLLLLISLGILVFDFGPIIFQQQRVGKMGQVFNFYKFRSMPVGTAALPSVRIGAVHLSWVGKAIRRTNLDELPQLVNIIKGDMSLVGPRPPMPEQVELIEMRRQNGSVELRPGLTGLAQINSYDGMSVAEKADYDGRYAQALSLGTDLRIILRTFGYLMKPPPVY